MGVLCNTTDSHITGSNPNFPAADQPISFTCWMSGIWSSGATAVKSFVGLYGPDVVLPSVAIQIGSRTLNNSVQLWNYGGGALIASGAGVVSDNTMHFIVYTSTGTTATLYVDGVQVATTPVTMPNTKYTNFYINGYPPVGTTNETSNHTVQSVRLYNRVLSADEVLTMFNARGARHSIVDGMVAYYEFDEGAPGVAAGTCVDLAGSVTLNWTGAGTPMTYTYSNAESKLRPVL